MYTLRYGPQLAHSVMLYYIRQTLLSSLEEGLGTRLGSTQTAALFFGRVWLARLCVGLFQEQEVWLMSCVQMYVSFSR